MLEEHIPASPQLQPRPPTPRLDSVTLVPATSSTPQRFIDMDLLIVEQMDQLLALFQPLCADADTIKELRALLREPQHWSKAHYLSTRIHVKVITAAKVNDLKGELQFTFEEICAKTLHNLSRSKKPFETDTPYWIIPLALKLAKALALDDRKILDIAMS